MSPPRDAPGPAPAPSPDDAPGIDATQGASARADAGASAREDAHAGPRPRHRHGRDAPEPPLGTVGVDVAFYHRSRLARQAALKAALQDDAATARAGAPELCKGLEHCKHSGPGVPSGRASTRVALKPVSKPRKA